MTTINTVTREQWLQNAVIALKPFFSAKGCIVPNCHVSCGFASTDVKRGHIGQCWGTKASADKVKQIFISPALSDSVAVLDALMHELIHAVDDCDWGLGGIVLSDQRDAVLQNEAYDKQGMLTAIREQFKIDWHGIHGANHWARVLHHGIAIGTERSGD